MEKNRKNTFLKDIETKTLNIKEFQVIEEKYINKTVILPYRQKERW